VLVFAVVEHFVKGLIHGENIAATLANLAAKDGVDIAARILVMFIAFIPMFAIWEIANLFGENQLFELFFERGGTTGISLPNITTASSLRSHEAGSGPVTQHESRAPLSLLQSVTGVSVQLGKALFKEKSSLGL
jgi:hypothetical protein